MRTIMTAPQEGVEVYDVDSGLGGHFTVSILRQLDGNLVEVCIRYGNITSAGWQSYGLFDGRIFPVDRRMLTNPRRLA